jgi:hypothetical protein
MIALMTRFLQIKLLQMLKMNKDFIFQSLFGQFLCNPKIHFQSIKKYLAKYQRIDLSVNIGLIEKGIARRNFYPGNSLFSSGLKKW